MYCDFCGNQLPYHVGYCSKCGRQLKDYSGDTQPIPIINETILSSTKKKTLASSPWYRSIFKKKIPNNRSKAWSALYYLASVAIIIGLIYVLVTFKTVKEYQMLLSVLGGLWALYILWKR